MTKSSNIIGCRGVEYFAIGRCSGPYWTQQALSQGVRLFSATDWLSAGAAPLTWRVQWHVHNVIVCVCAAGHACIKSGQCQAVVWAYQPAHVCIQTHLCWRMRYNKTDRDCHPRDLIILKIETVLVLNLKEVHEELTEEKQFEWPSL